MKNILVTGATGFLGYHVTKLLNERGFRPRALLTEEGRSADDLLANLDVETVYGSLKDPASLRAALTDIDTVLHMVFVVSLSGGAEVEKEMTEVNVNGTRNILLAAEEMGVKKAVVSSSALTVGINSTPVPLDETADWATYGLKIPYAISRLKAEQEALSLATDDFSVVVVNPSFTLGPDDFVGAPANKLLKRICTNKLPFKLPINFGCLDVRDYADGVIKAAEHGRSGRRYLLNGHNVTPDDFVAKACAIGNARPPRWHFPYWLAFPLILVLELVSWARGKPPKVSRKLFDLWNRSAWYNTELAQNELGWNPRPLDETLKDTIAWIREAGD